MGRVFVVNLEGGGGKIYTCKFCATHLALNQDVVSKLFQCKHGRAYLFNKVANVSYGQKEERMMTTGLHTVADIFCVQCGSNVGWTYETAHEKSQKYKEGKSVLERSVLDHNLQSTFKISGPNGGNDNYYWASQQGNAGGSDTDDS